MEFIPWLLDFGSRCCQTRMPQKIQKVTPDPLGSHLAGWRATLGRSRMCVGCGETVSL